MIKQTHPIVSAEWLNNNLNESKLIILDASIYADRSENFIIDQISIPNAILFDLRKDFIDDTSKFPNTIPSAEKFEKNCQKLGINKESTIITYDNRGVFTSPRAWWLFKSMGHESVYVLNGGLPAWRKEDFQLSNLKTKGNIEGDFKVQYQRGNIQKYKDMLAISENNSYCIIDARSEDRFNGVEAEPRPALKSGHIKNSGNLPYSKVLKNGFYRTKEELTILFSKLDVENKKLVFSCGSGITACIILLAAELVLDNEKSIYDGSWTEWATNQQLFTT
ncbi:MAG: sulfurtransferase [Crocinitomicaceae bacterium]